MALESWPLDRLKPYEKNPRTHTPSQVAQIAKSIQSFGFTNPIIVDRDGVILAGHGRLMAAKSIGLAEVPVIRLGTLTDDQRRALVIADNQLALGAGWDEDLLASEIGLLRDGLFDLELLGFAETELSDLLDHSDKILEDKVRDAEQRAPRSSSSDPVEKPEPAPVRQVEVDGRGDAAEPAPVVDEAAEATPEVDTARRVSRTGDVWQLGRHRAMCGDSTSSDHVTALLGTVVVDCILTDPPYCSGGFQEAGKSAGSIGTKRIGPDGKGFTPEIANDKLSTRGYMSLLKTVFEKANAPMLYVFTDWRMWINLFDVVETSGYMVRNMIVWDKGSPGMGRGWRAQHEIVMLALRQVAPFDGHKAVGNVIKSARTGNPLHPTQKPVDLIEKILEVSDMAHTIYDPFGGSGTVLIAAEKCGRAAMLMEMSPDFIDVVVKRWQGYTKQTATLAGDGRTFDEVAAARLG